jgi:polysaccharide biosynthesis/export protein
MNNRRAATLACLVVFGVSMACAQSTSPDASAGPASQSVAGGDIWAANLGDEPVGPGDLIYVTVTGSPEQTRSYRISPEGAITLPMTAGPLKVSGEAPAAVARTVTSKLVQDRILVAPIVSVAVLDYRSRRVSVAGAVRSPTTVPAVNDLKLLDAIARSGGIAPEAGPELIVSRSAGAGLPEENIRISIKDLFSGQNPELNLSLRGGEEVRVPEAPKLFVVGNVRTPGTYPLNEMGGTTLLKALAMSQGILPFTAKNAYVYREMAGAPRQEIAVPLREILHRKSPDVALLPNDILYIPENTKAHLSADVLDKITNFGGSTASGLIIWH